MIKSHLVRWSLIFVLAVSGCSSETGQPSAATPTTPPDEYPFFPTAISPNSAKIPVTWAGLNLTGKLVYSMGAVDKDNNYIVQIQVLDLATGVITVVYTAPLDAWIYYVSVSPDGKQVAMSFSPAPGENPDVVQALYVMPLDGSRPPELLFTPPAPADQYTQAEWSPDGKYIYYTHVNNQIPDDPSRVSALYTIFRMAYPVRGGSQEELIALGAYWPRLSSDSARLVYISVDPLSDKNKIMIADPDGGNAQEVVISGPYVPDIKDAPLFSPDGQSILFSGLAPDAGQSYQPNLVEKLLGIRVARASGEPSDWWSVAVSGGEINRLTNIRHRGLYADISPDHQHIASFSKDNLFVMKPDGSELTLLIPGLNGFAGTLNWIP
jgi:Tol biopolymer transport system component